MLLKIGHMVQYGVECFSVELCSIRCLVNVFLNDELFSSRAVLNAVTASGDV